MQSYEARLEALGPGPSYKSEEYQRWFSQKVALGEDPYFRHEVIGILLDGAQVRVSTTDRWRVISVPSGEVLYELETLDGASCDVSVINDGRISDDEPYAIAINYEIAAAAEKKGFTNWEEISVRPPIGRVCGFCGGRNCGTARDGESGQYVRTDLCSSTGRARELLNIRALKCEGALLGCEVDYSASGVVDDRWDWRNAPELTESDFDLAEASAT